MRRNLKDGHKATIPPGQVNDEFLKKQPVHECVKSQLEGRKRKVWPDPKKFLCKQGGRERYPVGLNSRLWSGKSQQKDLLSLTEEEFQSLLR